MAGYDIGNKILGEWEIVRLLGEGGSGRVYELRRQENGRSYSAALKVISIPNRSGQTEQLRAGGLSEREIAAHYKSRADAITEECALMAELKGTSHVVSYEDHKVVPHSDGLGWDILIRMELLTPLADYRLEHPMDEREVMRMGVHLCQALELCEKHGIQHRDVKPENIFVSPNGDFKLGDFGIASSRAGAQGASAAGTVNYAAPEVCAGQPGDASSDLYSLGLVLYQMMNGDRLPFCSQPPEKCDLEELEQALQRRLNGEALPEPSAAGGLFASAIARATAFRPQDRFNSAAMMRASLMRAVNSTVSLYGGSAAAKVQQPHVPADVEQNREPVQIYPPRQERPPRPEPAYTVPKKKSGGGAKKLAVAAAAVLAAAALIVLAVLLVRGDRGSDTRARQEAMDMGLKYLQQERYQEAVDAFTQAIELDPARADGYVSRGEAYYDLGTSQMYESEDGMVVMPEQAAQNLVSAAKDYETAGQIEPDALTGDTPGLSFGLAAQVYADASDSENAEHFNDLAKDYVEQSDTLSEQAQRALEQKIEELEERIRELESQQAAQPQPTQAPDESPVEQPDEQLSEEQTDAVGPDTAAAQGQVWRLAASETESSYNEGTITRCVYHYDDAGQLASQDYYNRYGDGTESLYRSDVYERTYDEQGRVQDEIIWNVAGEGSFEGVRYFGRVARYEYDENGRIARKIHYEPTDVIETVPQDWVSYAAVDTYFYDEAGVLSYTVSDGSVWDPTETTVYYDSCGNMTQLVSTALPDSGMGDYSFSMEYINEYNEYGDLSRVTVQSDGVTTETTTYTYELADAGDAQSAEQTAPEADENTAPEVDENLEMLRNFWQDNIGMDLTAVLADVTHDGKQDLIYADDQTNAPAVEISVLTTHSGAVEKVSICGSDTLHSASTDVFLNLDDASGMANIVLYDNYIGMGMFSYSFNEFYLSPLGDGYYNWETVGGLSGGTLELDAAGNVSDADFEPNRQQATEYLQDKMCIYTESWGRTDMWVAPNAATALGLQS